MPFSKEADTHYFYFNRFSLLNTLQGPLPLFDVRSFLLTGTKHLLYAQQAIKSNVPPALNVIRAVVHFPHVSLSFSAWNRLTTSATALLAVYVALRPLCPPLEGGTPPTCT